MKLFSRSSTAPPAIADVAGVNIVRISDRNAIAISEHYVLVMEGLSTYVFEHARGASFVVNNSTYNLERDRQYRQALDAAASMARSKGLASVYVLE